MKSHAMAAGRTSPTVRTLIMWDPVPTPGLALWASCPSWVQLTRSRLGQVQDADPPNED